MPNVPYPDEVNWQIGQRKWFLNTNLFLIKSFLITKFDYITNILNIQSNLVIRNGLISNKLVLRNHFP